MHKNLPENFAPVNQQKREKRIRKSPKKAKPGAFWVLEGMGTVGDGCERMGKAQKLGGNHGTDLSRLPPRSALVATGDQRPTTRTAGGPAGAPLCQILPHTNEKSQVPHKRYLTFLAGAEGLEPSARGFGVDVGTHNGERGRAGVDRFLPQVPETSSRKSGACLVL